MGVYVVRNVWERIRNKKGRMSEREMEDIWEKDPKEVLRWRMWVCWRGR
jgi:hypothetical protein